ncbi:diguanylate cyclase [Leifsonia sp. NPDC080035]|uniref:Diguanylate cyclase n=1 Tax=Leifsonia sp. NPDC080035 TaxID=3143936 RepID=A0AAU7GFA3_9MICO
MTESNVLSDPSERRRLEECVKEPIRTPGRIQSHGTLFVVDAASFEIVVASENAAEWLGRSVAELGSPSLEWSVASPPHGDPVRVELGARRFDAVTHGLGNRVVLELEPIEEGRDLPTPSVVGAIRTLGAIDDPDDLRQAAAEEIKRITQFDRVMVYRFFPDGHGEVAGEAAEPDMDAYRGLRFPASDIPQQARSLYVTKLSRAIVSTSDEGTALVSSDAGAAPIDLSQAELRAVSPHHLQFMRNMGQASTVSFSLISDGRLVGMITCAHRTERQMPILLRRALEVLTTQVTLQLESLESIARLRHDLTVRERRANLLSDVLAADDVLPALAEQGGELLDLVGADGAVLALGEMSRGIGHVPEGDRGELLAALGTEYFCTDELARTHPALSTLLPGVAGVLVVPVAGGALAFFRREVTQVIRWLGDQSADNRDTPLSPRRSFSEWRQSVQGTAIAWGSTAEEARDLGRELTRVIDRRTETRLARLALVDHLTGLQNRRAFEHQLDRAVAEERTGVVLFIDLDGFKEINDGHGHEAGDTVLRTIAKRLTGASRDSDVIARLAGDEFVVLSRDTSLAGGEAFAGRLIAVVGEPIDTAFGPVAVTASCGVVDVRSGGTPKQLLDAADAAMYRAKKAGRNRVCV